MPKQTEKQFTVATPASIQRDLAKHIKRSARQAGLRPLKLTITIPPPMASLFTALMHINRGGSLEDFAARAVCRWMVSEDAMQSFDDLVNELSRQV